MGDRDAFRWLCHQEEQVPWDGVLHVGLVQLHCDKGFPCAKALFTSKAEADWLDVFVQVASTKTPPTPSFNVYIM